MPSEMEVSFQGRLLSVQSEEDGNFVTLSMQPRLLYVPIGPNFNDRRSRTFLSYSSTKWSSGTLSCYGFYR
jgi:hypothetical protein